MLKRLVISGLIILVLGAVVWRSFFVAPPAAPPDMAAMGPMPVSVAAVLSREVTEYQEYSGRLQAVEQAVIQPQVNGTIEAVHFTAGAMVKAGDLLFTLDQRPFQAALSQAEAAAASASAQATYARKDYERVAALLQDAFVAKRDYDARRNAAALADAALNSAAAAVRKARLDLDYTKIRAPIGGRVGRAEITVGNVVQAAPSMTTLTSIVSITPIYVEFAMDEPTYLAFIKARQVGGTVAAVPVQVTLAGATPLVVAGTVQSFDNQLNPASGTIRVRAVLDNADGALVPGMYGLVRIAVPKTGASLLVAERAINTDQNKKFVYVVGADAMVSYRPVEIGGAVGALRIIKSGLQAGEKIIVNGLQRAHPGAPVQPLEVPMEAPPETAAAAPNVNTP
jgi:membrane fusion protein, multidrug efflux system